ncbi:MAG: sigma-54 dependent transcriptional regulator [Brevinematales bacterium]|nr:sigma-54 dependent transcriptional regulator [Brevinematales bacterium]
MKILVVDDNVDVIKSLQDVLEDYEIIGCSSIGEAKEILSQENEIEVAIIDIMLGEENGLDLLSYIKSSLSNIECIMISGYSNIEKAVLSIKMGAYDFIEKPISYQKIKVVLNNAIEHKKYKELFSKELKKYEIIGNSKATKKINELIEKASKLDFPVLIYGESGVGKEHIANLIHLKSKRGKNEMVKLNCAAIPESLFESEFFGYEKGAFTGAVTQKKGKIELAHNSTIFLDEIGELPLSQQAKLLRVLEDKNIIRVGGNKPIPVDFRLITATNKDLQNLVKEQKFREDLFYRIGVIIIEVPPLRERREDIPLLTTHFLKQVSIENNIEKSIDKDALDIISQMDFKGNIRELKNLILRLFGLSEGKIITKNDLEYILNPCKQIATDSIFEKTLPLSEAKKLLEKTYILTQLRLNNNNISKTAISLNVLPNNLIRRMKELDIKVSQ